MTDLEEFDNLEELVKNGKLSKKDFNIKKKVIIKRINNKKENSTNNPTDVSKEKILFAISLLGIFSILSGLGLIIAANWQVIPAIVKVAIGLALLAASLVATIIFKQNNKDLLSEAFLFISFLLIGGNIGLIQQTYHLSLSWTEGSFLWWILSLPLIFFTKYRLLPICSVGLIVFSAWDIIWNMNYMLVAGTLFILMMLTHFSSSKMAKFLREIAFIGAIFSLFAGDILSNSGAHVVGVITTVIFLILILRQPKNEEGIVRYYNYLFIFVAWRIFLLFWNAYYNLTSIGILLIVFGAILLGGMALYVYYYQQIQNTIKRLVTHE